MRKELMEKRTRARRRRLRVRAKVAGRKVPRLSVFRSNRYVWVQVIDDDKGQTIVAVNSKEAGKGKARMEQAKEVGQLVAERAIKAGVKQVVFDRGSYRYYGRVKAVAEGARKGGLKI